MILTHAVWVECDCQGRMTRVAVTGKELEVENKPVGEFLSRACTHAQEDIYRLQWRNYRNSGPWTNIQVEPSLPFPYSLSPSASSLLLILPHPFPSSLSLFPTLFFPFPPSPVLITARVRGLGSAIAPPAGRPPNAFLCNLQSKNCKSVKSLTHVQMS